MNSWALGNWISKESTAIFAIIKELQVHELQWHINRFESRVVPGYQVENQKCVGPCLWHFDIDVVFSCFDWNLCYSLYIDKVMWLESMLDKVTVTVICRIFFPHCWCIMRDLTTGNSFLWLLFICIITWHEKTAPVFTHSHLQQF